MTKCNKDINEDRLIGFFAGLFVGVVGSVVASYGFASDYMRMEDKNGDGRADIVNVSRNGVENVFYSRGDMYVRNSDSAK